MTSPGAATRSGRRIVVVGGVLASIGVPLIGAEVLSSTATTHIWVWPVLLFVFCLGVGVVAPLAGVGGGVLYVPLVSAFFPFHIDFVRAAGLLVAMSGALAAGPHLLRCNLANLRLAVPASVVASVSAAAGARIGLALPTPVVQVLLGMLVIIAAILLVVGKSVEAPRVEAQDCFGTRLELRGSYVEETNGSRVIWRTRNTGLGLASFVGVGLVAGICGLGAGWANVPVLNLVMGVPLKVAAATSNFLIAYTGASAGWVYVDRGAFLPFIAVPSIVGLVAGAAIGARLLSKAKPRIIRVLVVSILMFAGVRMLFEGLLA